MDLLIAAEEVRLAEQYRRSAAAGRWPVVDLVGAVGYEEDLGSLPGRGDDYSLLLTMTWDMFSGFRTRARVSAERAKTERARLEAEDVARRVAFDVARAFDGLDTADERVALLRHASEAAEELFEARRRMRASGNETAISVLDARSETFRARMRLADADFDVDVALLRLALATGQLAPAFVGASASGPDTPP